MTIFYKKKILFIVFLHLINKQLYYESGEPEH